MGILSTEIDNKVHAEAEKLLLDLDKTSIKNLKNRKGLIYTDTDGKQHCYLLEYAIKHQRFDIAEALLENEELQQNNKILEDAYWLEKKIHKKITVGTKLEEATLFAKHLLNSLDNIKMTLQASVINTTTEMFRVRALSDSGLHEAMYQEKDLKDVYKASETPLTMDARASFNGTYDTLAAKVWRERSKIKDKAFAIGIRAKKKIKKDGAKTAIKAAGLVALGLTTGGIGLGAALLGTLTATAIAIGREKWLNIALTIPADARSALENANNSAVFTQANLESLETLRAKRKHSTSTEQQKLLDQQIKVQEADSLSTQTKVLEELKNKKENAETEPEQKKLDELIKTQEEIVKMLKEKDLEAENKAIDEIAKLLRSNDEGQKKIAINFLNAFDKDTERLKQKGKQSFDEFRNKAKEVTNRAQANSSDVTKKLNAYQAFDTIDDKQYGEILYAALESQAATTDVMESLDNSYHHLLEVQRRDAFYLKLGRAFEAADADLVQKDLGPANTSQHGSLKKVQNKAEDQGITTRSTADYLLGSAASLISGVDATKNIVDVITFIKPHNFAIAIQDPTFQMRVLSMFSAVGKDIASNTLGGTIKESLSGITQAVYQNFSSTVLNGIASANLIYDISPVGACTMLALLVYTTAHDKFYTPKLHEQFSAILKFLNNRDISELTDEELKKLQALTGETIDQFGNLLPKSMGTDIERSKKVFELHLEKTQILSTLKFQGVEFQETLKNKPFKENDADKTKIYFRTPKDYKASTIHYHDGTKWCLNFVGDAKSIIPGGMKATYSEKEIAEIASFFKCERELSESQKGRVAVLNDKLASAKQEETSKQLLYSLTNVYRGVTKQIATKSAVETRDRAFELSRQKELMDVLKISKINPKQYPSALPIIHKYMRDRKEMREHLKLITELDPNDRELLIKHKQFSSITQPYEFLKNLDFTELEKRSKTFDQYNKALHKKLETLQKLKGEMTQQYRNDRTKIMQALNKINNDANLNLSANDKKIFKEMLIKHTTEVEQPDALKKMYLRDLKAKTKELEILNAKIQEKLKTIEETSRIALNLSKNTQKIAENTKTPEPMKSKSFFFTEKIKSLFSNFSKLFGSKSASAPPTAGVPTTSPQQSVSTQTPSADPQTQKTVPLEIRSKSIVFKAAEPSADHKSANLVPDNKPTPQQTDRQGAKPKKERLG